MVAFWVLASAKLAEAYRYHSCRSVDAVKQVKLCTLRYISNRHAAFKRRFCWGNIARQKNTRHYCSKSSIQQCLPALRKQPLTLIGVPAASRCPASASFGQAVLSFQDVDTRTFNRQFGSPGLRPRRRINQKGRRSPEYSAQESHQDPGPECKSFQMQTICRRSGR